MNKDKKFLCLSLVTFSVIGALSALAVGVNKKVETSASGCVHEGYHYAAVAATSTEHGNKEFWTCCKCHQTYLTQPADGTWSDGGSKEGGIPEEAVEHYFTGALGACSVCGGSLCTESPENARFSPTMERIAGTSTAYMFNVTSAGDFWYETYGVSVGSTVYEIGLTYDGNHVGGTFKLGLPKIDFTKYAGYNITFKYYDYDGDEKFGWSADSVGATAKAPRDASNKLTGEGYYTITFTNITATSVVGLLTTDAGTSQTTITDTDVLNGTTNATIIMKTSYDYQRDVIVERAVITEHASHTFGETTACTTTNDVIGAKTEHVCTTCGYKEPVELMGTEDVKYVSSNEWGTPKYYSMSKSTAVSGAFSNYDVSIYSTYGSMVLTADGEGSYTGYTISPKDNVSYSAWGIVYLPRVNYSVYSNVRFTTHINSGDAKLGQSDTNYVTISWCSEAVSTEYIDVVNNGTSLTVTITSVTSGNTSLTYTVSDAAILNGNANLGIYACGAAYRVLYVEKPAFNLAA